MSDPDDSVDPPPRTRDIRYLAIALAFVAAGCFGYAAFTKHWLVKGDIFGFGLWSYQQCAGDRCESDSNADFVEKWQQIRGDTEYTSGAFVPAGKATFVLLLLAAAGLVGAAAIALARKHPVLPVSPSSVALLAIMFALIAGCVFVATKPGEAGFVGVGGSFWVFGAGAIAGIAGAQMLAKINRPRDPDLMADAMNPDEF